MDAVSPDVVIYWFQFNSVQRRILILRFPLMLYRTGGTSSFNASGIGNSAAARAYAKTLP